MDRDKYTVGLMFRMEMRTRKIFIRLALTFGFSATAGLEELASLYDQEKDQRYLLYFTKYLGYRFGLSFGRLIFMPTWLCLLPEMYL